MERVPKKKKILIIDEDEFLSKMYARKFIEESFEVFLAPGGDKGIEIAKKNYPDIIILDIKLPDMDGYEVLMELKKNAVTNSIPIVILSNFFQKEDVIKFLKAGVKDYLIKSHFMPDEVVQKVKKIFGMVSR
ncbi:MAG: response regulator transcription factor [bacterium]